ncbi:MAG: SDR family oxidoreductase [Methanocellales archaeon]|nr:SDR family oxidoreductase [Methanocellales archaeon]MDD4897817.1 SDR family oxidoreductase [Methanocellales archaeon]MDD5446402.1 SDR family oxidoreductase [Methanocellales archaeon]
MSNLKFKNVLIIGGAGYVGSALVPSMLKKGYNVTVYDLYLYGDVFSNLEDIPNLTQVKADIRNREKLIEASKDIDAIVHLACISNDPSYELDPALGKSINYDAFFNVLEAAEKNNIKRFIYASSSSIYGIKEERDIREDASCEPLTDYSKYKLECEKELLEFGKVHEMEHVIVRPATVCGYTPRLRLDLVVNILTINALVNRKIKIFGGNQLRPNIHIKDIVRVYELLLSAPKEKINGQIFNAGYQNYSVEELAKKVKSVIGDPKIELESVPSDDIRSYHINSDKIRDVLGFEPRYTIEDAVRSLVDAYGKGLIEDGLKNPLYYNIKMMQKVNLR